MARKKRTKKTTKKKTTKSPKKAMKRVVKTRKRPKSKRKLTKKQKAVQATCKRAPKAIKKEGKFSLGERLYHLLTETSVVVYASKPGGDYGATFVSDNVKRLTGYTYRAFLRDPSFWVDRVHPDDRGRVLKEIPRLFEEGYYEYEYRFRHKKGHYIWVRDEMRCVCDENGKCVEIVGYWINVTKRKQMEEDVRQRMERILHFMESATEGFVLMDAKLNIIDVNQYLLDQFEWKIEDARGVNVLDLSTDLWESGRYDKYMEVLETGKPCVFEDVRTPSRFGNKHLNLVAFRVGRDIGLIVQDITQQKKHERKLQENEERLSSLYDSINAGIISHDLEGVVVSVNKRACEILDLTQEEMIGADLIELCRDIVDAMGNRIEVDDHPLSKTLHTAEPVRNRIVGIPSDEPSKKIWLLVNTEPIFDTETRKLDEVLCTFIDITEQKNIGDALEESEERYRHIFENSPIGIGISGMDGRVITANNAMLEITGYSLDEFRKINIADTYVSVDDRRRLLQALNQYGRVTDYLVRLKRKDGTSYDAILNITRINLGGTDYYHTMCQRATLREDK
jgi:PAS domain S-box-containing protein